MSPHEKLLISTQSDISSPPSSPSDSPSDSPSTSPSPPPLESVNTYKCPTNDPLEYFRELFRLSYIFYSKHFKSAITNTLTKKREFSIYVLGVTFDSRMFKLHRTGLPPVDVAVLDDPVWTIPPGEGEMFLHFEDPELGIRYIIKHTADTENKSMCLLKFEFTRYKKDENGEFIAKYMGSETIIQDEVSDENVYTTALGERFLSYILVKE